MGSACGALKATDALKDKHDSHVPAGTLAASLRILVRLPARSACSCAPGLPRADPRLRGSTPVGRAFVEFFLLIRARRPCWPPCWVWHSHQAAVSVDRRDRLVGRARCLGSPTVCSSICRVLLCYCPPAGRAGLPSSASWACNSPPPLSRCAGDAVWGVKPTGPCPNPVCKEVCVTSCKASFNRCANSTTTNNVCNYNCAVPEEKKSATKVIITPLTGPVADVKAASSKSGRRLQGDKKVRW